MKLGFVRHEIEPRLFIPMHIPAEALAMGLEQNDLDDALLPVRKAVEIAGLATVASNGYRLTTSRSMVAMPCAASAATFCYGESASIIC